jgi:hypothetical protein
VASGSRPLPAPLLPLLFPPSGAVQVVCHQGGGERNEGKGFGGSALIAEFGYGGRTVDGLDGARGGDRRVLHRVFGARCDHEDVLALLFPRYGWPGIVRWCQEVVAGAAKDMASRCERGSSWVMVSARR